MLAVHTHIYCMLDSVPGWGSWPTDLLHGRGRGRKVILKVWWRPCPWLTYKQVKSGAAGHSPPQGHILEVTTSANLLKPVSEQQRAARGGEGDGAEVPVAAGGGGRERSGVGRGGVHMHRLMEGGADMWSVSPALHVISGHICLGVGLEWVWGRIDEYVPVCLCIYEPCVHELG